MERKSVRFDIFLDKFLYGPTGYYTKRGFQSSIDFVTAPQKSKAFVKFICLFTKNYASKFFKDTDWSFVELGAGDGEVCSFFAAINSEKRVYAVEISSERRKKIINAAKKFKNLIPFKSIKDLPENLNAVVFANEFFDALSVRVFRKTRKALEELYFDENKKRFLFKPVKERIPEALFKLLKHIPDGTIFEYETKLEEIFQKLAKLRETVLFVIDYGFKIDEIERFRNGTLVGFSNHIFINDPVKAFSKLSDFDVTHQVNFSILIETARQHRFEEAECLYLAKFILENFCMVEDDLSDEEKHELLKIALPHNFGDTFKVIIMEKRLQS